MSSLLSGSIRKLSQVMEGEKVIDLPLDLIDPDPKQPRKTFDAEGLEEMAASIRDGRVHVPISVTPRGSRYLIVFGERRWRGSQMAGKSTIPVIVRQYSDLEIQAVRLIENRQREDVSPIEEAAAIRDLIDLLGGGRGVQKKAAEMLGISEEKISQSLRLMAMPESIKEAYDAGHINDATTAVDVARIHALDPAAAGALVKKAKTGDLKRAEVRAVAKATKKKVAGKAEKVPVSAATPRSAPGLHTIDMRADAGDSNGSTQDSPAALSVCQNSLDARHIAVLSELFDELANRSDTLDSFAQVIRLTMNRAQAEGLDYWKLAAAINGGTRTKEQENGR